MCSKSLKIKLVKCLYSDKFIQLILPQIILVSLHDSSFSQYLTWRYVPFLKWLFSILPYPGPEYGNLDNNTEGDSSLSRNVMLHKYRGDGNHRGNFESAKGWWLIEDELAERLLAVMEAKGGMGFVVELRRRFRAADTNRESFLSKDDLQKVLDQVGMLVTRDEVERLALVLGTNVDGRVSYGELLQFLLRHLGAWEQREAGIATKIFHAMGSTTSERRRWIAQLRKRFFGLDRFQDGLLGGENLLGVLRGLGVHLKDEEGARLLDALEVEPWEREHDRDGSVRYSELLRFCARHAGPMENPITVVGQRFRDALKRQIGPFFLQDVRSLFNAFDLDGDGLISPEEFSTSCDKFLEGKKRFSLSEKKNLIAAIDTDSFGKIAYPDFVRFIVEPNIHKPWFRNDVELAERFAG